ncbi:MAG TPA: FHA domain-containing protein [Gemmatimonadales bacterium]|nr:FHA domain-containing protein [Gemmatimonadales bacterium]
MPFPGSGPGTGSGTGTLLGVLVSRTARPGVPERSSIRRVPLILGHGAGSDLRLEAPSVSGTHAEISLRSGVWFLRDLGSTTGSWVDGERVEGLVPMAPGSTLRLGEIELVLVPHDRWEHSDVIPELAADMHVPREAPRRAAPQPMLALEHTAAGGPSRATWAVVTTIAVLAIVAFLIWGR